MFPEVSSEVLPEVAIEVFPEVFPPRGVPSGRTEGRWSCGQCFLLLAAVNTGSGAQLEAAACPTTGQGRLGQGS